MRAFLGDVDGFFASFCTLGVIFGAILNPWGHFLKHFVHIFGVKKTLRREKCPRNASKRPPWFRSHVLEGILDVIFSDFSVVLLKMLMYKTCDFSSVLLMCFSCNLEQCKPVKYSKNAVGSFKNMMYRKSEKINARSDFS